MLCLSDSHPSFFLSVYSTRLTGLKDPDLEITCSSYTEHKNKSTWSNQISSLYQKNIAIKYQNFRIFLEKKLIQISYIDTMEQTAGIFIKPIENIYIYLQRNIPAWWTIYFDMRKT